MINGTSKGTDVLTVQSYSTAAETMTVPAKASLVLEIK